jgi:hypothetical protein
LNLKNEQSFNQFMKFNCPFLSGDVLSGNVHDGSVHLGVLQEWFGIHWWNSRAFALLFVVIFVVLPLVLFRRVGKFNFQFSFNFYSFLFQAI